MMHARARASAAAFLAALVLACAATAAGANWFQVTDDDFRIAWSELTFAAEGGISVTCPVTVEGTFHEITMNAVEGNLLGSVTSASVGTCRGGTVTLLSERLPWSVTYESFTGTLPRITSVTLRLLGAAFVVRPEGLIACLYQSSAEEPAVFEAALAEHGEISGMTADEGAAIDSPTFLCPDGVMRGTADVTVPGTGEDIMLFLEEIGFVASDEAGGIPLSAMVIPRTDGFRIKPIRNDGSRDMKIEAVFPFGPNESRFRVELDEADACRLDVVITDGRMCRIRVRYLGALVDRPLTSNIGITVEIGRARLSNLSFSVRAESN